MYVQNLMKYSLRVNMKYFLPLTSKKNRAPAVQLTTLASRMQKHTPLCPVSKKPPPLCGDDTESSPASSAGGGGEVGPGGRLQRAERSGKCRFGFIPDEWFTFFYSQTGKSGGYVFLFGLANYCVSKEILVMEHEYYGGLSWILVLYFITTRFGKNIGSALDKQVDDVAAEYEIGRTTDKKAYQQIIKDCQLAIEQAQGQSMLMDAKKENVKMQLEAIYRERCMEVYRTVKGRMDYQVKLYYTQARVHQKWMVDWIIREVMKGITPEFEKRALSQAIGDLERAASKA